MEIPPLTDDTVRLAMVGQVLRRRWRLLAALAVLGAAVGAVASILLSPGYKTTSNVLLQGPRQADELLTQAQVATSSVVLDRAAAVLPWHPSGADLQKKVTASVSTGNGNTVVLGSSERPAGPAAPTMVQLVAGGAVLFFLAGVFGHLFAARADRRLRGEPEIGSALGSPILAGVDVTTTQGDRLPA